MIVYRVLCVTDALGYAPKEGAYSALPAPVAQHIEEKKSEGAKNESLAVHLLLRALGEENGIPDILSRLCFDGGRPVADGVYVSLSHAGGLVAAAIADTPVGIDVEPIRPLPRMDALAARYFAAGEREVFSAVSPEEKEEAFFRIFTKKEAYAKANGIPLAAAIKEDLSFLSPEVATVVRDEKSRIPYVMTVILSKK